MKKYLQLDGGGVRGILIAVILRELERITGKKVCEIFDLITGSSTGAIIGGCAAAGVPMDIVARLYIEQGKKLFTPRSSLNPLNWFRGKYDRTAFQDYLDRYVEDRKMGEAKTNYMATAFNLVNNTTEFVKSWKAEHARYQIKDVITWSALSAAYYFGKICVPSFPTEYLMPDGSLVKAVGAVFQDGGQGINNCTLGYVLTDILASDVENAVILSIGCGSSEAPGNYDKVSQTEFFGQIFRYPFQARAEATENQISAAAHVAKHRPGIKFHRMDIIIPKKADKLDATKYIELFVALAQQEAKNLPAVIW